jgi:aryl-alcohol dehydrogenase-like predicted oxidoreductase
LTLGFYQALEELLAAGRVRAIGVSNFMPGGGRQQAPAENANLLSGSSAGEPGRTIV